MRAFFHFLVLFASSRTSALFLFACVWFLPNFMFSYGFSFEMVSSEQILGVMTVGRSSAFHVSSRCVILPFGSTSLSRFLYSQKLNNLAFIFFFSAMCVIDDEVHTRAHALTASARWFSRRRDRVCGGDVSVCLLLSFPLFIHNSLLPVPPYKWVNKRISFCLRNFVRKRPNDPRPARSSLLANDCFLAR